MLDTSCSEVVWRVLATHSIRQFPLHFPTRASPCAITFQLESKTTFLPFRCHCDNYRHLSHNIYLLWKIHSCLSYFMNKYFIFIIFPPSTPLNFAQFFPLSFENYVVICTSFIHLAFCLKTGPKPLPKQALHIVDLELPPSNDSIISFPQGHPVASHVFFLVFLSLISPLLSFLQ